LYNNILSPSSDRRAVLAYESSNYWVGFSMLNGWTEGVPDDPSNIYDIAPQFVPGTVQLRPGSRGINEGLDVGWNFFLDVNGNQRVVGEIDMGAAEQQSP
jgi:hypothetical protein